MVKIIWNKGLQFTAEDDYNHSMIVDTDKEFGGFEKGFRPMDLLLVALISCMGMDIVPILQKKGGKVDKFEVTAVGERLSEHPKGYRKITVTFRCGGDYKREDLLRSFELSRDKYCSVVATLHAVPDIEYNI